jgi:nucleotide-binding universal stress UspA family protein
MERIVVGMDGSARAANALRWAVEEGSVRQLPVVAVLCWSMLDQHHVDDSVEFDPDYSEQDAVAALDAFVTSAVGSDAAGAVEREVVCERRGAGLLAAAAGAALLVLGSRGLGGFRGLLMGSVSQQCLHHAPCPVAIVRPLDPDRGVDRRIVVGIDGSANSRQALDWALDEARARGCAIEVVHTWAPPYAYGYPTPVALDPAPVEARAREMVERCVDDADTTGLAGPVEVIVTSGGSPAAALLVRAEAADLVVVGARGVGGFRGLLLGSLAHQVAVHAPCPAVVVPPADPEP